ncbi:MAG TPA: PGPGW domain-containing protein [Dermatophilaceae bacterium]|nr:PGPGW domain-containing protein [Dermatophilaceae bacterium]
MSRNPSEDDPKPANVGNSGTPAGDEDDDRFRDQIRDRSAAAFHKLEESTPPGVAARLRSFREVLRRNRGLDTAWRVMVFALGVTLVVAGVIMFVIPGPGWATVILGLVVLASEFRWANRALAPVKDAARRATEAAMDPRRRRRNLILAAVAGVLIGAVMVWYLVTYGLTLGPILALMDTIVDWVLGLFD